jgi:outer membrane biogenesis lipoprotein LolB
MCKVKILVSLICIFFITGCSYTLHKREKNESNPLDQGSETQLHIRGPRAAIEHKF